MASGELVQAALLRRLNLPEAAGPNVGGLDRALQTALSPALLGGVAPATFTPTQADPVQWAYESALGAPAAAGGRPAAVRGGGGHDRGGINPEFERRLNALIAASGGRLSVGNAYRSTARQAQLFAAKVREMGGNVAAARKWVAPPGRSKHQSGVAADLKGDLAWAHANAAKYGLYFPMPWERWHVELRGSRG